MFPEWSRLFLSVPVSWRGKPSCHMQIPGVSNNLFTLSIRFFWFFYVILRLCSKKNMVYGTLCQLTITHCLYLIVNSIVSYPPPLQRERGGVGKILPIGWAHFHLSANFQNNQEEKESTEKGEGRGESWLWIDILWSMGLGNPMPELTW